MRRHYKLKHPYVFHTETEKSKKAWKDKRKSVACQVETENNKEDANADIKGKLPISVLTQVPKKRRSALWQHFVDKEKGYVSCKICNMKLRDRHYIAVLHLNRRHPKALADLGDFNFMPFRQRNNFLWNFFIEEGNKLVRCLLCGITMQKNMSKHLQSKHPDDFKQAMTLCQKRKEITKYCEPGPPNRPRTWVKKYCTKIGDKQYRCKECGIVLRMPNGLYGNMRRHIRNKHPNIHHEESKEAKEGKINTAMKEKMIDVLDVDSNSNALKDPLADFDLGSPGMSETEIASNFLRNDNLESNLCSEIDMDAIADLPVLEQSGESDNYDKSYFLLVNDSQYKCIQCKETVNCTDVDEQEALFIHIRDKHPEEIMTIQATSTENDDEYQVVVLGNLGA